MLTTLRVAARADAPAEAPTSVDLPYPVIDRAPDMREALGALMADPGFVEAVERKRAIEGLAEPRDFLEALEKRNLALEKRNQPLEQQLRALRRPAPKTTDN